MHQFLGCRGLGVKSFFRTLKTKMCRWTHLEQAGQIVLQELLESLVELQAYKLSPTWSGGLFGGLCRGHGAPALAGLMDTGTIVIYMSEVGVKEKCALRG